MFLQSVRVYFQATARVLVLLGFLGSQPPHVVWATAQQDSKALVSPHWKLRPAFRQCLREIPRQVVNVVNVSD